MNGRGFVPVLRATAGVVGEVGKSGLVSEQIQPLVSFGCAGSLPGGGTLVRSL